MIVALTPEAMYLKGSLEMYGHKVVPCENYRGAIDAVVYRGVSVSDLRLTNSNFVTHSGVLVVDCTNHSAAQINNYLKQRTFSSIFN
jgi:hypothetical protein